MAHQGRRPRWLPGRPRPGTLAVPLQAAEPVPPRRRAIRFRACSAESTARSRESRPLGSPSPGFRVNRGRFREGCPVVSARAHRPPICPPASARRAVTACRLHQRQEDTRRAHRGSPVPSLGVMGRGGGLHRDTEPARRDFQARPYCRRGKCQPTTPARRKATPAGLKPVARRDRTRLRRLTKEHPSMPCRSL